MLSQAVCVLKAPQDNRMSRATESESSRRGCSLFLQQISDRLCEFGGPFRGFAGFDGPLGNIRQMKLRGAGKTVTNKLANAQRMIAGDYP
jgi:hypothetical protein